jgi:hypothetical protein
VLRRHCPGKKLGLSNVRLFIIALLATFDILPMEDENGKLTVPDPQWVSGLSRSVRPPDLRESDSLDTYSLAIPSSFRSASSRAPTRLFRFFARKRHTSYDICGVYSLQSIYLVTNQTWTGEEDR